MVGSTNTYATELARHGAADGTLVITDEQPAGRGRVGRSWRSLPRQQVLLSLVLRPVFPAQFLVMAAALAVAGGIADATDLRPDIKWPNDVLHEGRKLCGILIETGASDADGPFAVLGIGINVNGTLANDSDLAGRAATLADAVGHDMSREEIAVAVLKRLDALYTLLRGGGEAAQRHVCDEWRARLVTLGKQVEIAQGGDRVAGLAEDVDEGGALLLRRPNGDLRTIFWGDVR